MSDGQLKAFPEFEPYERYYVEVEMLIDYKNIEETLSNLSVYFTTNRKHPLMFTLIPKRGYGTDIESIRIYEDDQIKLAINGEDKLTDEYFRFAELTDGVLDSKEKYFHGA